jgi:hypothetical protein
MKNIHFKIGQPNTGKSYTFREDNLKKVSPFKDVEKFHYKIIPVSGGIGNEYKGLQNTDLALSYDPINKVIRFGEFLQMLMSAIIQPTIPHVVFLDDFHNQDISSLLSEYTPLFKGQQKVDLTKHDSFIKTKAIDLELAKSEDFETADKFISQWNDFIKALAIKTEKNPTIIPIPVTNRISGSDLQLIFPTNFYLLGAANFNEKTLNIFADWNDRAELEIIDPLEVQSKFFNEIEKDGLKLISFDNNKLNEDDSKFIRCCLTMNQNLKDILHEEHIFDYQKYCFGIWKVVDENNKIIEKKNRVKTIEFFFSMIKNSLIYNNKNSHINNIGLKLIQSMENDTWFKNVVSEDVIKKIKSLDVEENSDNSEIFQLLHSLNIYDN